MLENTYYKNNRPSYLLVHSCILVKLRQKDGFFEASLNHILRTPTRLTSNIKSIISLILCVCVCMTLVFSLRKNNLKYILMEMTNIYYG